MATVRKRAWISGGEQKTTWLADYSDQAGKRHQMAFKTKKEADAFLVQARHEVSQGTHTAPSKSPTVADAGLAWIATALADGLERSTLRQYEQHLHLHIEPHLGATKLADLSPAAIERFRRQLDGGGRFCLPGFPAAPDLQ